MSVATIDTIRSLAFGGISSSYAPIGTPTTKPCVWACFTNTTDGDLFISDDGINDKFIIVSGSFKLPDIATNGVLLHTNTQLYVRQSTAPSMGSIYVEIIYGG